ncbi:MAG: Multi-copper polyphenol oxidoreductase laccase, partial [Deltaproteobacteria bacterium]|nr:Multi-copper polyphenol oxidoreductase laccase [Deltaproteobacteria bacterium]
MNFLEVEAWKDQKKILHGFGTRNHSGDKITRIDWRGEKVVRWKKQLPLVSLHQVHKDGIVVFQGGEEEAREHWEREGDALITAYPGIAISVFTADCLPIL